MLPDQDQAACQRHSTGLTCSFWCPARLAYQFRQLQLRPASCHLRMAQTAPPVNWKAILLTLSRVVRMLSSRLMPYIVLVQMGLTMSWLLHVALSRCVYVNIYTQCDMDTKLVIFTLLQCCHTGPRLLMLHLLTCRNARAMLSMCKVRSAVSQQ